MFSLQYSIFFYSVHSAVYSLKSKVYSLQYTVYSLQSSVYSIVFNSVQSTINSLQPTLYSYPVYSQNVSMSTRSCNVRKIILPNNVSLDQGLEPTGDLSWSHCEVLPHWVQHRCVHLYCILTVAQLCGYSTAQMCTCVHMRSHLCIRNNHKTKSALPHL